MYDLPDAKVCQIFVTDKLFSKAVENEGKDVIHAVEFPYFLAPDKNDGDRASPFALVFRHYLSACSARGCRLGT